MSHFISNRIVYPADNGPSFNDWVQKILKEASDEAKPGIGQEVSDEPRGQLRGQVVNTEGEEDMTNDPQMPTDQGGNARPDTGGTTDAKSHEQTDKGGSSNDEVKEAKCGKEMGECSDAGNITETHTDAGPGDDENPEPKILINNDPCYQKGESEDGGKVKGDNKKQPGENVTKASAQAKFEKIANMDRIQKLVLFQKLSSNKDYPIEYVEAMTGLKFANLTEEEKSWLSDFWKTVYPPDYVADMVKDR